jgi:hypothetical protein
MSYEESGEDYITRSFTICTPHQIKSRRMRGVDHVASMGTGNVHTGFWWGNLMDRDRLQDKGIDGRIIIKWGFQKYDGGMEWIGLAHYMDRWRALVTAIMKHRVS